MRLEKEARLRGGREAGRQDRASSRFAGNVSGWHPAAFTPKWFLSSEQPAESHVQMTCFRRRAGPTSGDSWASAVVCSGQHFSRWAGAAGEAWELRALSPQLPMGPRPGPWAPRARDGAADGQECVCIHLLARSLQETCGLHPAASGPALAVGAGPRCHLGNAGSRQPISYANSSLPGENRST